MRLNLQKLRERGWEVHVDEKSITIFGRDPLPFVGRWVDDLNALDLDPYEVDRIVGSAAERVEETLILRAGREL